MGKGKVYLVGAGPAGKDLITVRGLQILQQADVVIYDYLVDGELLDEARPDAELICGELGDKKLSEDNSQVRLKIINALLIKKAKAGKKVVRLKNGDPFIFGRAAEEITALLENKIEYEVVPGITAAQAAASFSGIPLTDRRVSSSVVFVTGHEASGKNKSAVDWKAIAGAGTIVLYMAVKNISGIVSKLTTVGKSPETPVAVIHQAGGLNQKICVGRLKNIAEVIERNHIGAPAIFIIGDTVACHKQFDWLKKNKRILFTGLSNKRFFIEGTYFHLPLIAIKPLDTYAEFDGYLKNIREFDWVVFTSRYGVEYFFKRLTWIGKDARILSNIKIAAVGTSTARHLLGFRITADLVPNDESSRGLLSAFAKIDIKDKKIFLPRSNLSDKGLVKGFKKLGAKVTASVVYKNVMPDYLPDIDVKSLDEIMFTSPSGVRNFNKRYGKPPKSIKISCIGDVTLREAKKLKLW